MRESVSFGEGLWPLWLRTFDSPFDNGLMPFRIKYGFAKVVSCPLMASNGVSRDGQHRGECPMHAGGCTLCGGTPAACTRIPTWLPCPASAPKKKWCSRQKECMSSFIIKGLSFGVHLFPPAFGRSDGEVWKWNQHVVLSDHPDRSKSPFLSRVKLQSSVRLFSIPKQIMRCVP